jgi:hypothetical protein
MGAYGVYSDPRDLRDHHEGNGVHNPGLSHHSDPTTHGPPIFASIDLPS